MCADNGASFGCDACTASVLGSKRGWIECKSNSFPGRVYYFNTITGCSTWRRPVPRKTQLSHYTKFQHSDFGKSPPHADVLSGMLDISGSEGTIFGSENPPSEFELHARRMEMYLKQNAYCCSGVKDELRSYYQKAKIELSRRLCQRKREKKPAKAPFVKPNAKPIAPTKIVRECYGITTVSYDLVPRELPPGVEILDLSDTSVDSIGTIAGSQQRPPFQNKKTPRAEFIPPHGPNVFLKVPNLSDSDLGSTDS